MPSLVTGREMNNYDFDRGGPRLATNGGFDHYRDDYGRDDMRRDDDDRYRRGVRNGGTSFDRFNTDYLDQNSLSDFRSNEPKFELDHLATFAAGTRNGCIHAEDGLRKLRQMENTTGIWTMRCVLIVERGHLVILDNSTGEELERFQIQLVQDPTAIFKNDRREIYNNLILFTIVDDPKKRSSQADMHIFQSCKAPAQEIVDEILAAKNGQQRLYQLGGSSLVIYQQNSNNYRNYRSRVPPPPAGPAPEPPGNAYNFQDMREYLGKRGNKSQYNTSEMRQFNQTNYSHGGHFGGPIGQQRSLITRISTLREKEDFGGGSTEILERDVQLLNHCFDDIEKFVARLQQAAESYKELEKRKRDRGAKNKKRQSGDGMLNARARPPPDRDFVDIFQKFKLSFNLLAKLKAHIHDPNAPELVHFLFTPLSLIYEASRDPYHGNQNLGDQAVAPVLTGDAKQLLLNCLTSKEIELWQALGKHWTTSRDEWNGHIPPYVPEFYDGWQPAAGVIDELTARSAVMSQQPLAPLPIEPIRTQPMIEDRIRSYVRNLRRPFVLFFSPRQNPPPRPTPFPDDDRYHRNDDFERFDSNPKGYEPSTLGYEPHPRGGFEPLASRGFEPLHATRGYEPSRSLEPPGMRGYEPQSRERSPARSGMGSPYSSDFVESHSVERNLRSENPKHIEREPIPQSGIMSRHDENAAYFDELRRSGDATIYEAVHDRPGKNAKELTVQKGDILQVLDSSKNWWKLRNFKGQVGFAPYTILKQVHSEPMDNFNREEHIMVDRLQINNHGAPASRTTNSEASFMDDIVGGQHRGYPRPYPGYEGTPAVTQRSSYTKDLTSGVTHWSPHDMDLPPGVNKRSASSAAAPSLYEQRQNRTPDGPSLPQHDEDAPYSIRGGSLAPQPPPSPPRHLRDSPPAARGHHVPPPKTGDTPPRQHTSAHHPPKADNPTANYPRMLTHPSQTPTPPSSRPDEGSKYNGEFRHRGRGNKEHFNELHARVTSRVSRSIDVTKLTKNSSPEEVWGWLVSKGFSDTTREAFQGYTGWEMFQVHLSDIVNLIGHDEAIRLDGLLTLQKSTSGYGTRSAKELNDILQRRKQHITQTDEETHQNDSNEDTETFQYPYEDDYRGSSSGHSLRDLLVHKRGELKKRSLNS
ncbi:unnamed protein product [Lymnaea stagnalis]|uniref:SH3 domain-containing protein n=1 Tax=Lymnaea stagnalis TaxID=6523 RepID=A0AAV2HPM3_LYMST